MILVFVHISLLQASLFKIYQICKDNGHFRDKTHLWTHIDLMPVGEQRVIKHFKGASHLSLVYLD